MNIPVKSPGQELPANRKLYKHPFQSIITILFFKDCHFPNFYEHRLILISDPYIVSTAKFGAEKTVNENCRINYNVGNLRVNADAGLYYIPH